MVSAAGQAFDLKWVGRRFLPERHGMGCRLLRRLRGTSVELIFEDGFIVRTESHLARRRRRHV